MYLVIRYFDNNVSEVQILFDVPTYKFFRQKFKTFKHESERFDGSLTLIKKIMFE